MFASAGWFLRQVLDHAHDPPEARQIGRVVSPRGVGRELRRALDVAGEQRRLEGLPPHPGLIRIPVGQRLQFREPAAAVAARDGRAADEVGGVGRGPVLRRPNRRRRGQGRRRQQGCGEQRNRTEHGVTFRLRRHMFG